MKASSAVVLSAAAAAGVALASILALRLNGVDPVKGPVSSRYGMRNGSMHNGTDIAVPVGTPVRSPWRGKVADVYSNSSGGLQVLIDHPNGFRTGYAHLSAVYVAKGDRVGRGRKFAKSGNSGNSTGPHLHFTLRKDGILMDPEHKFNFK